jgi:hypothetical protein
MCVRDKGPSHVPLNDGSELVWVDEKIENLACGPHLFFGGRGSLLGRGGTQSMKSQQCAESEFAPGVWLNRRRRFQTVDNLNVVERTKKLTAERKQRTITGQSGQQIPKDG